MFQQNKQSNSKIKPLVISYDTEEFLKSILALDTLNVNSTPGEFVSNLVKSQIWEKIQNAKNKGSY